MYGAGFFAAEIGEFFGVIVSRLLCVLCTRYNVVHQIERQEIGLLVMAPSGHLPGGSLDHHAAVELRQWCEFFHRHMIIDDGLDRVDMRRREIVLIKFL